MDLVMEIIHIILPIVIVGGIGVFVILRMKHKYKKGALGKKKTKSAQTLLDSLLPLGMMFGFTIAVLLSMFSSISLLSAIAWGPGIGFLVGYLAYEISSKIGTSN